jgi:hypothetical protein
MAELAVDVTDYIVLAEFAWCARHGRGCGLKEPVPPGGTLMFISRKDGGEPLRVCKDCFEYYQNKPTTITRKTTSCSIF